MEPRKKSAGEKEAEDFNKPRNKQTRCACWRWEGAVNQLWTGPLKLPHTLWHSFKWWLSEKPKSVRWSMSQTGHVADRMKADRARRTPADSYWTCSSTFSQEINIHLWFTQQHAASFLVPLLQSILKTSSVIRGKQKSSDTVLAAAFWMMSIIREQMTAIHLRIAPSYLTYPYLADLVLSNANLPLFPLGTGIRPCTSTLYQIGRARETSLKKKTCIQSKVANNLPKRDRGSTWTSPRRLWVYCRAAYALNRTKEGNVQGDEWNLLDVSPHGV